MEQLVHKITDWFQANPHVQTHNVTALFRDYLSAPPYCLRMERNPLIDPHLVMVVPEPASTISEDIAGLILSFSPNAPPQIVAPPVDSGISHPISTLTKDMDTFLHPEPPVDRVQVHEMEDGAMLRIFWHNRWLVSTSRTLDASAAYWSSEKSIFQLFCETVWARGHVRDAAGLQGLMAETLNKDFVYFVVLTHPDHQNIVRYTSPRVTLIGKYSRENHTFIMEDVLNVVKEEIENKVKVEKTDDSPEDDKDDKDAKTNKADKAMLWLTSPRTIQPTTDALKDRLSIPEEPGFMRGLMVIHMIGNVVHERHRFDFDWFTEAAALKANNKHILRPYLQSWPGLAGAFRKYFPLQAHEFYSLDEWLNFLSTFILMRYRLAHVRKCPLSSVDHFIEPEIRRLHYMYLRRRPQPDGRRPPITVLDVEGVMRKTKLDRIWWLCQHFP